MPHNNGFSVFIGLDWANRKHDVCVQKKGDTSRDFKVIEHSPEAIEQWIQTLYGQCKGQIAIAIELDKGPIIYALQKYHFVTIFPIHAATLAKYRQTFTTSGAKNDPTDAEIALDMMLKFPDKIKPLSVQSSNIRKLQRLVEQRRDLVGNVG